MGAAPGLFVYGTLLRCFDHPLNRLLLRYADGVETASTRGQLYDLGEYPGMVLVPLANSRVVGEFYYLSRPDTLFRELDAYEGVNSALPKTALFSRSLLSVSVFGTPARKRGRAQAWAYILNRLPPTARKIESGNYQSYRHGSRG